VTKGADIRAAFLSNAGAERVTLRKKRKKKGVADSNNP